MILERIIKERLRRQQGNNVDNDSEKKWKLEPFSRYNFPINFPTNFFLSSFESYGARNSSRVNINSSNIKEKKKAIERKLRAHPT